MNNPILSVIIPVYNVRLYLKECLDSVLNQTYQNMEIICVDDGSTDGSSIILDEYTHRDNRVKVVHKANDGLVSARKAGIMLAKGRYITYVDSDDWIDKEMFQELMHLIEYYNADVVTSGCVREYGECKTPDGDMLSSGLYFGESIHKDFHERMVVYKPFFGQNIKVSLVGKIFRRDLIEEYQMKVDNIITVGEDSAVTYPCLLAAKTVYVSGLNLYHYRMRRGSVADTKVVNQEMALVALQRLLYGEFSKHKNEICNATEQSRAISLFNRLVIMPETVIRIEDEKIKPFCNASIRDRIVIYGAGRFGRRFYKYLIDNGANIVAVVDQNVSEGIIPIGKLKELEFDKVLIAVLKSNLVFEITDLLKENGVAESVISTIEI